ncbi:hypothetical protein V7183_12735, partial [Bacillus sp. JJ1127]
MRKIVSFSLLLLCMITTNQVYAYSPQSLPVSQHSKQWKVNIDEVNDSGKNILQSKKDVFHTYRFSVQNIGKDEVYNVQVEVFRNEPNTGTKYELFSLE